VWVRGWARSRWTRVDWCAVAAVPIVTVAAFLDPVDAVNGVIQHLGLRLTPPSPPPAAPAGAAGAPRTWAPGDGGVQGRGPRRPRPQRPARAGHVRRTGPLVNSRPPSKPSRS